MLLLIAAAEEWKVGAPAHGLAAGNGHIVVALRGADIPPTLEDGVRQLQDRGIRIVRQPGGDRHAYLVDEEGVIRRRGDFPSTTAELLAFVNEWEAGRALFRNRCARCHGEDGMDVGYPFIRQLGGIGSRWSRAEIRTKLNPAGSETHPVLIRGDQYSRADFEALVTFLGGL